MKYNDPIILKENEVHYMVLQKIRKGSKVLEFGAAGGRMTRLLAEDYSCTVYIVEYEREAYELAAQYALDGICADIEDYQWKKWLGAGFDYILFCDVLEHLKNPKKVLQETQDLLKDDGSVLISIPNICHNDILVKLYNNRFEYTDVGLLDNTHIHFFSEYVLDDFVAGTGYAIMEKQYKTVPIGMTEQYWKEPFYCRKELYKLLQKRENGEVYQFILALKKEKYDINGQKFYNEPVFPALCGLVYFDRGEGFTQDDVKEITGSRIRDDEYEFKGEIFLEKDVERIRIDPVEGQMCRLVSVECSLGTAYIPNKASIDGKEIIMDEDPQMIWEVTKRGQKVLYDIHIRLNMDELIGHIIQYCRFLESKNKSLNHASGYLERNLKALKEEKEILVKENGSLKKEKVSLEQEVTLGRHKIMEYAGELLLKEKELDGVYQSRSWRCTRLLRIIDAWIARWR